MEHKRCCKNEDVRKGISTLPLEDLTSHITHHGEAPIIQSLPTSLASDLIYTHTHFPQEATKRVKVS